jgi:transcriptional regulator with XRE-family HTH domain
MSVIKQLREKADLSQYELAAKLGKSQGFIAHLETGRIKRVSFEDGLTLAGLFHLTPDEFRMALESGVLPETAEPATSGAAA